MRSSFVILFLALIGFTSCEKYLEFDEEVLASKLVVNGIINPDSTFKIHISNSLSVIDNADLSIVENANVVIYDGNGGIYETLTYYYNGVYEGNLKPILGDNYTIEVSAPDFVTVTGSTSIPNLVNISQVDTLGVEDVNGYKELKLTIVFQDLPNESNYYLLEILGVDNVSGTIYETPMQIRSDDVTLGLDNGGYSEQVYFTDELFDGETKTLVIYVEDSRDYDDYIEVRMTSLTQDLERYARTYQAYQNTYGNPFSQPVQVYNNIENGFGIFAGYQVSRKKITF